MGNDNKNIFIEISILFLGLFFIFLGSILIGLYLQFYPYFLFLLLGILFCIFTYLLRRYNNSPNNSFTSENEEIFNIRTKISTESKNKIKNKISPLRKIKIMLCCIIIFLS